MEKNIIFLYPLLPIHKKIIEHYSQDPDVIIFETDSIQEFNQTVGILENGIILSGDLDKTIKAFELAKKSILAHDFLSILSTSMRVPLNIKSQLAKSGHKNIAPLESSLDEMISSFQKYWQELQKIEEKKTKLLLEKEAREKKMREYGIKQKNVESNENIKVADHYDAFIDDKSDYQRKKVNLDFLKKNEDTNQLIGYQDVFTSLVDEKKRKKKMNFDIPIEERKKNIQFVPFAIDQKQNKKIDLRFLDQDAALSKKENVKDENSDDNRKKNKRLELNIEDAALSKKDNLKDENNDDNRKKNKRLEINIQDDDRKNSYVKTLERDQDKKKEKTYFEEDLGPLRGRVTKKTQEELKKEKSHYNFISNIQNKSQRASLADEKSTKKKKIIEDNDLNQHSSYESIWDHGKIKKNKKVSSDTGSDADDETMIPVRLSAEEILALPQKTYFLSETFSMEYLVLAQDIFFANKIDAMQALKFINFILFKMCKCSFVFFGYKNERYVEIYNGITIFKISQITGETYQAKLNEQREYWQSIVAPDWKDNTFLSQHNEFVFPFYYENIQKGHFVCFFDERVKNQNEANLIEAILLLARSSCLELWEKCA